MMWVLMTFTWHAVGAGNSYSRNTIRWAAANLSEAEWIVVRNIWLGIGGKDDEA